MRRYANGLWTCRVTGHEVRSAARAHETHRASCTKGFFSLRLRTGLIKSRQACPLDGEGSASRLVHRVNPVCRRRESIRRAEKARKGELSRRHFR